VIEKYVAEDAVEEITKGRMVEVSRAAMEKFR
jgi:hypothetical protein